MQLAPIKVVHLVTYLDGGAGTAAYRIHKALLKAGVDSSLLCLHKPQSTDYEKVFVLQPGSGNKTVKPGFWERQKDRIRFRLKKHFGIAYKTSSEAIPALFESMGPQLDCEMATLPYSDFDVLQNTLLQNATIIHLHWIAGMLDYPSFFKNNKKPVVWTLHDMNPLQGLFHYKEDEIRNAFIAKKIDKKIRLLKRKAIRNRKADLVFVTPSKWLYGEAKRSPVFKNVHGFCIANPIDTALFSISIKNDFKQKHAIDEKNIVFLFVAHAAAIHRKGFDLLTEALKKLKHLPITLIVLGKADNLDLPGLDIRSIGTINDAEELRNYYAMADAFIIPSREDNLPNVMLESLACGTPVIGFSVGGIKEHIVDFKTGLIAAELNATSLAKKIENFSETKNQFSQEEIMQYAEEHFNEQLIAGKYVELYKKILRPN